MVEMFFSGGQVDVGHYRSDPMVLLSGPPSSGKTSLLFQFAYNAAAAGGDVVFICNRDKLESKPPFLSQEILPSSDTFTRIHMKYVDNEEGIKKYFAAFHLHDTYPLAVVIDDFGDFFNERYLFSSEFSSATPFFLLLLSVASHGENLTFFFPQIHMAFVTYLITERVCRAQYGNPRGRDMAMVRVLALCHNALRHANEKGYCGLILSDTHYGDSPRLLFIYKRWIHSIFTVKGDGGGSFLIRRNIHLLGSSSKKTRIAKYSIALQYLFLEQIIDDEDDNQQLGLSNAL
ncbi:hypothetical protein K2173_005778 [Erythroxylum novogranatense]|uniref:Uncharacterized protein n=1 Tax=Erythroxylum novogranatense TaxID=1862640 RepID=A0AAV8U2M7_9ROSI|nr:hypothetical protein K2173_005778 [Erythroxylum novogranatense]